jgi:hypothetical protein
VVEHLPSKREVLNSKPSTTKKKKSICLTNPVNKEKPHAIISVDSKNNWVTAFNIRPETIKPVGENKGKHFRIL